MRCALPDRHHLLSAVAVVTMCAACDRDQRAAEPPDSDAGRRLWSAFECSSYADMAGRTEEQQRLFRLGVDTGRRFVEAVRDGTLSEADVNRTVPVPVITAMAGPTTDFVLGRIYATATQQAFDRVSKEDSLGTVQPVNEWVLDKKVQTFRAESEYHLRNCALLR